jgi:hypothetical protein
MPPSCIENYGKKRDTIEKLCLMELVISLRVIISKDPEFCFRYSMLTDMLWEYFKDERYFEIRIGLLNLIVPEWITLMITNPQELSKIANERLKAYLS